MKHLSFILIDYLQGKSAYSPITRILSIVFTLSITSVLFETLYFKYQWNDFLDYKAHADFLIKGYFIVPLILYLVVYYGTYFASYSIFSVTTSRKSARVIKRIMDYRIKKKDIKSLNRKINTNPAVKMPLKVDEAVWLKLYNHVKTSVTAESWAEAEAMRKQFQRNIERNFILFCRAIIAITIYFVTVPHFGSILFGLTLTALIVMLITIWWMNLGLDVLPTVLHKVDSEIVRYMNDHQPEVQESA